ncbi:small serum protein 2-like [Erythrolamprus reginae]|uniref:small serum protein 2-like n=1 Tax=Erythrolamprus reginae TaxID=121349 RepID=UPI00396C577A
MGEADSVPTSERRAAPGPSTLLGVSWSFPKAKMKIFLSLILFSLMLATCQGACFLDPFKAEIIDGEVVNPSTCTDIYDGRKHLIGSTWNTEHCNRCSCNDNGARCCHRYGGVVDFLGCKSVVNPVTCEYEHYRLDDLTQRCDI